MVEILIAGLALGSLYAIVALGYTMVYGIIELINFAHGDVFTFGVFVAIPVLDRLINQSAINISPLQSLIGIGVAMIVSALLCGILGVAIERLAYRPLRNAPRLAPLITAIGVSLIIENALFQWQGGGLIGFPSTLNVVQYPFLGGATITNVQILVIAVAVLMMIGLDLFVNRTNVGKAMRAVAQDREAAAMMGINVDRIISLTFLIGSALAGAGAVIYGIEISEVGYDTGFTLGLFAFTAAVVGGIGNIRGAMLGGILIGVVISWVDNLGSGASAGAGTEWYDVVVFAILVLILVFRPAGLLGTNTTEKV
ncbi:MAG TPA: branched-chain amino acid ABC transporter permease [Chloroflexota bacterium]|nr:branched-chain amino acid ABC transporter permease [Chloroflexota bacterium]